VADRGYRRRVSARSERNPIATRRQRLRPRDVAVAAIVLFIQVAGSHAISLHRPAASHGWWAATTVTHLDALGYGLLCLGPLALLARNFYPRAVLAFVFTITAAYAAIGYPAGPVFLSLIVAFAVVVNRGYRGVGIACIGTGWILFLCLPWALGTGGRPTVPQAVGLAAWLLVLLAASEVLRSRRERTAAVQRSLQQEGLRKAEEERLRIARELHDVLAHNISLINVQSGVALHLLDERPEQARTALTVINEASAEALREIRTVLGALRRVDEEPPRRPAASLERLPELVSRAAAAGLEVDVRIDGEPRSLPSEVDLAAYRILQESLTNVSRHAGAGQASVSVHYGDRELELEVDDDGRANDPDTPASAAVGGVGAVAHGAHRRSPGTGNGIIGMRERAAALGGDLEAGPRPNGGFRVRARIPLGAAR
jgi:signal transduction histidine kinase